MKTKIRTLLAICILGFIGLININAIADIKKVANTEVINENAKLVTNESVFTDQAFFNLAQELTAKESDAQIEKYANKQILLNENLSPKSDFIAAAESFTAQGADQEVSKYVQKLITIEHEKSKK